MDQFGYYNKVDASVHEMCSVPLCMIYAFPINMAEGVRRKRYRTRVVCQLFQDK